MKPVCLVIGAGAGIGGNVARRFAQEGYHACLCRRSDLDGLNRMVDAIKSDGGSATGFLLNAIEANSIEERVAAIEADIGPIEVVVYNLGAQIGDRALKDTSLKAFETGLAPRDVRSVSPRVGRMPADGSAGQGNNPRDLGNSGDAWERRATFPCGGDGRATNALPDTQRRIRIERNPCRTYRDRRRRGCPRHFGENARAGEVPTAERNPRQRT